MEEFKKVVEEKCVSHVAVVEEVPICILRKLQYVQFKSKSYINMSNLFTNIYNIIYYTTNLYLQ